MIDRVSSLSASLDDKELTEIFRVQSDLFEVSFPNNNIFGIHEGMTQAISDGYWLFLQPLPPGAHTIRFHGIASFPNTRTVEKQGQYELRVYQSKPIIEKDPEGQIHFHPSEMLEGKFYPFDHKGKRYLLTKSSNNLLDLYEIIGSEKQNE